MDRLEAMKLFTAVVDVGSFSGAARQLNIPLATVSRKVADLESHIKTRLLLRSTRRLALTEAGESYFAACRRILDQINEAERIAGGEYTAPTGDLVITAPIVFGRLHVLPIVTAFLTQYPQIDIRLVLSDRSVNLLEDHVDLAVRIGDLKDSDMVATPVGSIQLAICASPEYFAMRGMPHHPEELSNHDCVCFDVLTAARSWIFGRGKAALTVPVHSRLVVNTAEAAVEAAVAGVGITRVLSYQIASARKKGQLVVALEDFAPPAWPIHLVHAGQGLLPQKLRAFLDFAVPRLRGQAAEFI